ncbi:MAG: G1 family endopeptidase [Bacteroidetes bacterium]|nr:G1 family endopeptidase [Bacteroidota bacterium]
MKRIAFVVAAFAALAVVAISADAAAVGLSQAPNIKVKNGYSTNWAGYAIPASGGVSDVIGTWTVPAVQQCGSTTTTTTTGTNVRAQVASNGKAGHGKPSSTTTGYSSAWVGIDGYNSNTVEQIGTEQDCINGAPRYYAWYEMYPQYPTNLSTGSFPVKPGDSITGEVAYTSGNSFTLTLTNKSQTWSFATNQTSSSAQRSSAEWILEAPWSGRVLPLADFGVADFSGSGATILGRKGSISNWKYDAITMITTSGQTKAYPSGLTSGGSAFDVTWAHQ